MMPDSDKIKGSPHASYWRGMPGGLQTFMPCRSTGHYESGMWIYPYRPCAVCVMIGESLTDFGAAIAQAKEDAK